MKKNILLALSLFLSSCAYNPYISEFEKVGQISELEKQFLYMNFYPIFGIKNGYAVKTELMYKKDLKLYVYGNSAREYKQEIDEAVAFFAPAFNVTRVDNSKNADIDLYMYEADSKYGRLGAFAEAKNYLLSYSAAQYGQQFQISPQAEIGELTTETKIYPLNYFKEAKNKKIDFYPCGGEFFYNDFNKQKSIAWTEKPETMIKADRPDKVRLYINTGLFGPEAEKILAERGVKQSTYKEKNTTCLIEELGHAFTMWPDVPEELSKGFYRQPSAKKEQKPAGEVFDEIIAENKAHMKELQQILSIYSRPYIKNGMSKESLIKAFQND